MKAVSLLEVAGTSVPFCLLGRIDRRWWAAGSDDTQRRSYHPSLFRPPPCFFSFHLHFFLVIFLHASSERCHSLVSSVALGWMKPGAEPWLENPQGTQRRLGGGSLSKISVTDAGLTSAGSRPGWHLSCLSPCWSLWRAEIRSVEITV